MSSQIDASSKKRSFRAIQGWLTLTLALVLASGLSAVPGAHAVPRDAAPLSVGATGESEIEQFDAQVALAMQYMRTAPDESTYFDVAAARSGGADTATLEIGDLINRLASSQRGSGDATMTTMAGVPIWGNWCGPGHGGGAAIDVLDSICQTHDRCYDDRGYFACSCDREIVADIRNSINQMTTGEKAMAVAVSTYFTYCLCNPFS
ncbi:hypothetical protein [Cryobacterium sp. MLB-32]|uniref:hypothetical protein n=1 Tax=Cryobacterium sp. MLB-32 TaxID=1529318 RepID=UPI000A5FCFBD|nr:hypothetical protein [Cryobacterium sp. MLB-32]